MIERSEMDSKYEENLSPSKKKEVRKKADLRISLAFDPTLTLEERILQEERKTAVNENIQIEIEKRGSTVKRTVSILSSVSFVMIAIIASSVWLNPFYSTGVRPAWVYCLSKY